MPVCAMTTIVDGRPRQLMERYSPSDAVIDGPGENGNRDNEWDVMEGAYLQLDGYRQHR